MKIIQALVVRVDNFTFASCQPVTKDINCEGATVVGMAWMVPLYGTPGVLTEWLKSLETDKPTLDSIRVIIVQAANPTVHTYYIAVEDDATPTTFTDLCNACCGDTPAAPAYTPPIQIVEDCICADAEGNYNWEFPLPLNPNGLRIKMTGYSFNGAYGVPDPPASFANAGAVQTWLAANWAAYGTWSQAAGVQKLVSTDVKCMGIVFELVPATYCLPLPVGTLTADAIVVQINATGPVNTTVSFPGGAVTYGNATGGSLIYVLSQLLNGAFSIEAGPLNKIQYTGLSVPVKLQNGGVDVVGGAFSVGACQNVFEFPIPDNPGGDNYTISGDLFDGVAGTPVVPAPWATTGAMLIWLNANWSAYGTWTIVGTDLILTSPTTVSADLTIDLVP